MKKLVLMLLIFKNPNIALTQFSQGNIALQSAAADARSVYAEGELVPGNYLISIFTTTEGTISNAYLSIYFNCKKNEIEFENKS